MTMNMPPSSNHAQSYLRRPIQPFNPIPSNSSLNTSHQTLRPPQQSHPNLNRSYSPNFAQLNRNQTYNGLNASIQGNSPKIIRELPTNTSFQQVGGNYFDPHIDQGVYQGFSRSNNFIRQPQFYPQQSYPVNPSNFIQQSFPSYYQPLNQAHYQPHYQEPYNVQHYPQVVPQTYAPLYTSNFNPVYNQPRKNIPEQSINSNFSYENANFDCNYSVQENLVHCVLCNQTYKTSQKKQHLELHRQKVKNVDIRPVDEQQLKRLQKYNAMTKKGLMVKPIVEPDEFNVQYNPNEFVLRKVTQYKDLDAPGTNQIQIQTEDPHQWSRPQDLGYSQSRRSHISSPERGSRINRISQSPVPAERQLAMNRNTNTRFNEDSIRVQEPAEIFLTEKLHNQSNGESFKQNYKGDDISFRESQRKSQASLGYQQSPSLKARNAQSINQPSELGYGGNSRLQSIQQDKEEYRRSHKNDIPIENILEQVKRQSQY